VRNPLFAAVVGDPVEHSLSPELFRRFSEATGRSLVYRKLRVPAAELEAAFAKTENEPWAGWNVTLPHKVAIVNHLTRLDETASHAGAVNVVRFEGTERVGYNTDVDGFLAPLEASGFNPYGKRALVLGAGGAARAVCLGLGRKGIKDLVVLNRTIETARVLAEEYESRWGGLEAADREAEAADIVVNATSLGLTASESPVHMGVRFKEGALAYDLVYRPVKTPFLRVARAGGARTIGGMPMLAAQAALTWKIWFGETLPAEVVDRAARELEEMV
jgi:shikimate dehydrogenase